MRVERYKGRHWAVYDQEGILVVVTVYRRGAWEVARRLSSAVSAVEIGVAEAAPSRPPMVQERKVEQYGNNRKKR